MSYPGGKKRGRGRPRGVKRKIDCSPTRKLHHERDEGFYSGCFQSRHYRWYESGYKRQRREVPPPTNDDVRVPVEAVNGGANTEEKAFEVDGPGRTLCSTIDCLCSTLSASNHVVSCIVGFFLSGITFIFVGFRAS